ncbi:type I pullulanase [Bacillus sp. V2I10]|uniref:type I pullulanase n=1 Tax=Bacillus sp. V2I10 TaxID=3042276 RepID=UPI00278990B7|nr:type I pullulanase [Bacillus sp. V2I10]MDQ0858011.1 pullulanase [Bacillus sp. V2I10]
MLSVQRAYHAYLDEMDLITILIPKDMQSSDNKTFFLLDGETRLKLQCERQQDIENRVKYQCRLDSSIKPFGKLYEVCDELGNKTDLQIGAVIRTDEFDEHFYYEGDDLGVRFSKDSVTMKLWSPTATDVRVKLLFPSDQREETLPLKRDDSGIWTIELKGNFDSVFYTYLVCVNLIWNEAVDPYAKAVSMNGVYGVIADFGQTVVEKRKPAPLAQLTDAIIYEAHIRDFTIHPNSGINQKGKYAAFTETDTKTGMGMTSGISYLKELGITHLELLPFNDFEGVNEQNVLEHYNWGYNPLHFNAPEGSYSSDPENPYTRIKELKTAIQAIHANGMRVIMDVVYNHVYIRENSSFEKIVPGYFFRHDQNGLPSNGTGVGNDFASEMKMASKFIIDSITFWLKEYDVDGFRFDLMGILDIHTMNKVNDICKRLKPDILILGEGWDLLTPLPYEEKAIIANAGKMPGIAFFNDQFRDNIKGSTFEVLDKGFILGHSGNPEMLAKIMSGSIAHFTNPAQSINYVESHDNHTLWDKMNLCLPNEPVEYKRLRQKLAAGMVILAQGIPFLHSGQEFYRTKQGVENSYKSPDEINQLNWNEREQYANDVRYIQHLISLRKSHGAFRLSSSQEISRHYRIFMNGDGIFAYCLNDVGAYGPWRKIAVIHCSHRNGKVISLPWKGEWELASSPFIFQREANSAQHVSESFKVKEIGTFVLFQK